MQRPKPTTHELFLASRNGGKMPETFQKRHEEYEEWLESQEPGSEEGTEDAPKVDNTFDNLPDDTEYPYHYGGGNFYLSDGTKVAGKPEAIEAQKEIDSGG